HRLGEGAGATAQFQHPRLRTQLCKYRRQRIGHAAGEQAAELGRGGEVATASAKAPVPPPSSSIRACAPSCANTGASALATL
ncbi:hypothetical protein C7E17_25765, partial [Stenotrophomonas maltophilia]